MSANKNYCPVCLGTRFIERAYDSDPQNDYSDRCPACDGTGRVEGCIHHGCDHLVVDEEGGEDPSFHCEGNLYCPCGGDEPSSDCVETEPESECPLCGGYYSGYPIDPEDRIEQLWDIVDGWRTKYLTPEQIECARRVLSEIEAA